MDIRATRTILDGLAFPEGPRWHDGRLWFSDMHRRLVFAVGLDGRSETICEVPNRPSGLGWAPSGELLVVSMTDRRLLRLDALGLTEVADLSSLASSDCNDMVVDEHGRAYIGNFGFDLFAGEPRRNSEIVLVDRGGQARVVAEDLAFPNGSVITPDGGTLIVGETMAARLTAFDVEADGSLVNRRTWAETGEAAPDGICLDANGGIWLASPGSAEVVRITEGGRVTDRVRVETQAYACMLGGPERRHLFICTSVSSQPEEARRRLGGRIEVIEVDVPGAGLP